MVSWRSSLGPAALRALDASRDPGGRAERDPAGAGDGARHALAHRTRGERDDDPASAGPGRLRAESASGPGRLDEALRFGRRDSDPREGAGILVHQRSEPGPVAE